MRFRKTRFGIEGTLYLLKADEEKDGSARLNLIQKALASLEHALKIKRWLQREYAPVLEKANNMF